MPVASGRNADLMETADSLQDVFHACVDVGQNKPAAANSRVVGSRPSTSCWIAVSSANERRMESNSMEISCANSAGFIQDSSVPGDVLRETIVESQRNHIDRHSQLFRQPSTNLKRSQPSIPSQATSKSLAVSGDDNAEPNRISRFTPNERAISTQRSIAAASTIVTSIRLVTNDLNPTPYPARSYTAVCLAAIFPAPR